MKIRLNLALCILLILVIINIKAQNKDKEQSSYYWFKAKIETNTNNKRKRPEYKIIQVSPKLESGPKGDFIAAYKHNLGNLIVTIGPFTEKEEAERSLASYEYIKSLNKTNDQPITINNSTKYFWFYSRFKTHNDKIKFERTAARINTGTLTYFNQYLYSGLKFEQLCIGPFTSHYNAEIAKFHQRKIGEQPSGSGKHALKKMARQVDQISVRQKATIDSVNNLVSYKLDIFILPRYLNKKSVLILKFQLKCENTTIKYNDGIVVQGEKVQDNNIVISDERGGMISPSITFKVPNIKETTIEKLLITPTYTNYSHIVQGKDIEIIWKYE